MHFQSAAPALKIADKAAAISFFATCLGECDPAIESLFVAHLDRDSRCVHLSRHSGDSCSAEFPLRQIVADALLHGTSGILLAHNHPSGDPRPSRADCQLTRRLAATAEAMDCTIVDHLVFGGSECSSFRELGLI